VRERKKMTELDELKKLLVDLKTVKNKINDSVDKYQEVLDRLEELQSHASRLNKE
jgi:hypothetical protein